MWTSIAMLLASAAVFLLRTFGAQLGWFTSDSPTLQRATRLTACLFLASAVLFAYHAFRDYRQTRHRDDRD